MEERLMRQILLYLFILFACSISAEQFKITGKVVDNKNNEPLIGAGVYDVNARRGTYTDIDGNFNIEVEKGAILKFSFVGYASKEVEVLNDSSLVVELENQGIPITPFELYKNTSERAHRPFKNVNVIERDSLKTNPKNQNSRINH